MKYNIIILAILILIIYIIIRYLLYNVIDKLLYQPVKITNYNHNQSDEIIIKSLDNQDYIYIIQKINPNSKKHIIYSHGSATNMNNNMEVLNILNQFCSVTMYDYRGYGKSTGKSSEETLKIDILTVYMYLTNIDGIDPHNIILYGKSLGVFPTLFLAKYLENKKIKLNHIVIESGFASTHDIISNMIPSIFSKILFVNRYKNKDLIKDLDSPILLAHSPNDEIVRFNNKDELLKHNNKIKFFELSTSSHYDDSLNGLYLDLLKNIIQK